MTLQGEFASNDPVSKNLNYPNLGRKTPFYYFNIKPTRCQSFVGLAKRPLENTEKRIAPVVTQVAEWRLLSKTK